MTNEQLILTELAVLKERSLEQGRVLNRIERRLWWLALKVVAFGAGSGAAAAVLVR